MTPKLIRYARRLVQKYDRDADGRLAQVEWRKMQGEPARADYDQDGYLTEQELAQHVADYSWHRAIRLAPPGPDETVDASTPASGAGTESRAAGSSQGDATAAARQPAPPQKLDSRRRSRKFNLPPDRLPAGLPEWFDTRDIDGDGQLSLAEYSPRSLQGELRDFARWDQDGDGVLTPQEYLRAAKSRAAETTDDAPPGPSKEPAAPPVTDESTP